MDLIKRAAIPARRNRVIVILESQEAPVEESETLASQIIVSGRRFGKTDINRRMGLAESVRRFKIS